MFVSVATLRNGKELRLRVPSTAERSCDGVTCNPHKGDRLPNSEVATESISAEDVLLGCVRREDLLFLPNPSFAPIFFQLFPDMAF